MRYKRIFFLVLVAGLFPRLALAVEVDEVVWEHPGYDVTIHRTGEVRVDFILNQPGHLPDSSFLNYPNEKFLEYTANPEQLRRLFQRIDSPDRMPLKASYRAAEGTYENQGGEVVTTLILKSKGVVVKQVELGSSREKEWPRFLLEIINDIHAIAVESGPLPIKILE